MKMLVWSSCALMLAVLVQILSSVLLWNFALTSQLEKLPSKIQKDFVPTLINGKQKADFPFKQTLPICPSRLMIKEDSHSCR